MNPVRNNKTWYTFLLFMVSGVLLLAFFKNGASGPEAVSPTPPTPSPVTAPLSEVLVENLEIPWDIAFLPAQAGLSDGDMLVTERPGRILLIGKNGSRKEIPHDGAKHAGEGGLLGLTLHPNFSKNNFLYIYLTAVGAEGLTVNRVERYRFTGSALVEKKTIIDGIPGALYHDGGRIEFGPDGYLYITTGDATHSAWAEDLKSLAGKTLRLKDDGSIPADNPFGTAVYSYGHRNSQGLAWDSEGRLWSTEHGPSSSAWPDCCQDEVNIIEKGKNYGWPKSVGDTVLPATVAPPLHSGRDVWAPASAAYLNGSLFFGGLRGEALYEAVLDGTRVKELKTHFYKEFGRIRTVRVGPDGLLYLTTSNRDDRGNPQSGDDKIIRVNPRLLSTQ